MINIVSIWCKIFLVWMHTCVNNGSDNGAVRQDKWVFHKEGFQLPIPSQCWEKIKKSNMYICMLYFLKWIQHGKGYLVYLLCCERMSRYLICFESIYLAILDQIDVYCAVLSGSGVFLWNLSSLMLHVCVWKLGCNRVCHLLVITGTTSLVTFHPFPSHCNSFEDWTHVCEVYQCQNLKWVVETWMCGKVPVS